MMKAAIRLLKFFCYNQASRKAWVVKQKGKK